MPQRTRPVCSLPDCDRPHSGLGYCHLHLYRFKKYGDPYKCRPRRAAFTPAPCRADGCEGSTTLRSYDGLCEKCIGRMRRNGDLDPRRFFPTKDQGTAEVLMLRSQAYGECVHWTGPLNADGYGVYTRGILGVGVSPHRASWEMAHGPVPDGLQLDHVCHTQDPECHAKSECMHRRCINPDHLEPVTWEENMRRARHRTIA